MAILFTNFARILLALPGYTFCSCIIVFIPERLASRVIGPETLKTFIETFNKSLKKNSDETNIKSKADINDFFKHWVRIINRNGNLLLQKIMKLVTDKHNVSESYSYCDMDYKLMSEIFGDD